METIESRWAAFQSSYYFWDIIALLCGVIAVPTMLYLVTRLLGLPGRIAAAREHPEAQAVYTMGWLGFLAVVPWIQAFIWAFKPTDKVDVRRFPKEEQEAEQRELAAFRAAAYGDVPREKPASSETSDKIKSKT